MALINTEDHNKYYIKTGSGQYKLEILKIE
jgi:hypothetical protein